MKSLIYKTCWKSQCLGSSPNTVHHAVLAQTEPIYPDLNTFILCPTLSLLPALSCLSAEPDECPVFTDVLNVQRHKRAACLSAPNRSLTFYGAVSQAWPGNSCGAPSPSLGPARALKLSKCHRAVNAQFHCC